MADYFTDILFEDAATLTLAGAMASQRAVGALYLSISYTDPIEGALTFLIGSSGFDSADGRVYPAITDWGSIRNYLGGQSASEITIALAASANLVPTTGTTRYTVHQLFQNTTIRTNPVEIKQWNQASGTSEPIWKGYLVCVNDYEYSDAVPIIRVLLRSEATPQIVALAPTVNQTDYANAPTGSIGQMLPVAYGDFRTFLPRDSSNQQLKASALGYPMVAVQGVAVNEKIASGTYRYTEYIFSHNDGILDVDTVSANSLVNSYPSQAAGDFYVYIPEMGAYGIIDPTSILAVSHGANYTSITISNAPRVHVVIRPLEVGASHTASITDTYKPIDSDSTNYINLTSAGQNLAFAVPNLNLGGARVEALYLAFDMERFATVDVGLWNAQESGGANWWGGKKLRPAIDTGRLQFTTHAADGGVGPYTTFLSYTQADASTSNGGSTSPQFQSGKFVGLDNAGNEVPIDLRVSFVSGTNCKIYAAAVIAQIVYPRKSTASLDYYANPIGFTKSGITYDIHGRQIKYPDYTTGEKIVQTASDPNSSSGLQVLFSGRYLKDGVGGTYSGTSGGLIQKVPDILRHLLIARGGFAVNTTSGTLGNLTDMRTEDVTDDKIACCSFVGQPADVIPTVKGMETRWPVRIVRDNDIYNVFGDDMNPDPSRIYRSSSEPIRISAKRDMVGLYMRVQEDDPTGIINRVTLNYGIGYGRGDSLGSYRYDNPLSQDAFGVCELRTPIDEPWIIPSDPTAGTPQNAKYLAQWYGRRAARPRLNVIVRLTGAWFDLKRGHVVEFDEDLESVGLLCPAFRCGQFDYAYSSPSGTTNQAFDTTPEFVPSSGTSYSTWLSSQQYDQVTFYVASAGTFTKVTNAWKYWNGSSRVALTGVSCSDAGDPDELFKRTGAITLRFDRPTITSWKKAEMTFNGVSKGPGYPLHFEYTSASVAATGNYISGYPGKWYGRPFEVLDTSRDDSRGVPVIDVLLREIM